MPVVNFIIGVLCLPVDIVSSGMNLVNQMNHDWRVRTGEVDAGSVDWKFELAKAESENYDG